MRHTVMVRCEVLLDKNPSEGARSHAEAAEGSRSDRYIRSPKVPKSNLLPTSADTLLSARWVFSSGAAVPLTQSSVRGEFWTLA